MNVTVYMVIKRPSKVKPGLDFFENYFYHRNTMGRPPKNKRLLMNIPLRIMLTAEQKAIIEQAAAADGLDMTAWARPLLLQAAQERVAKSGGRSKTK